MCKDVLIQPPTTLDQSDHTCQIEEKGALMYDLQRIVTAGDFSRISMDGCR